MNFNVERKDVNEMTSKDTVIVFVNLVVKCKPMTLTLKRLFGN